MTNEGTAAASAGGHEGHHDDHGIGHAVPLKVLAGVAAALLVLTVITVVAAQFRFGPMEVVVAMAIATVKASLVCAYFMHLRYDKPFHAFIFIAALVFVGLFITFALMDARQYDPDVKTYELQEAVPGS